MGYCFSSSGTEMLSIMKPVATKYLSAQIQGGNQDFTRGGVKRNVRERLHL